MHSQNVQTAKSDIQYNITMIPFILNPFYTINYINPLFYEKSISNLNKNQTYQDNDNAKQTKENIQFPKLNITAPNVPTKTSKLTIQTGNNPKLYQSKALLKQKNKPNQQQFDTSKAHQNVQKEQKKASWTLQEDNQILQMVSLFGKQWKHISQHFPERSSKQIRQRYLNYLRPNISHEKWTQQEDLQLIQLIKKYGRQWKIIQKYITTRSQNQLKNRFYGKLKKVFDQNQTIIPN